MKTCLVKVSCRQESFLRTSIWIQSSCSLADAASSARCGSHLHNLRFYVVGQRQSGDSFMETPQPPCNQKQRDVFARMLAQAKDQAQKELDLEGDEAICQVENEVLNKLAPERGAT